VSSRDNNPHGRTTSYVAKQPTVSGLVSKKQQDAGFSFQPSSHHLKQVNHCITCYK